MTLGSGHDLPLSASTLSTHIPVPTFDRTLILRTLPTRFHLRISPICTSFMRRMLHMLPGMDMPSIHSQHLYRRSPYLLPSPHLGPPYLELLAEFCATCG